MDVAKEIEARLMPQVNQAAAEVRAEFALVKVSVEAHPYRNGASYELAISCELPDRDADEPDLLELEIGFDHLDGDAVCRCADVVWGHGSGFLEYSVYREPAALSASTWDDLTAAVPALTVALKEGLRRGCPPVV
jgi:hypothetical protein